VLPLGTLVAQRLANPAIMSVPSRDGASTTGVSKQPFLRSWHSSATANSIRQGVTTYVSSDRSREKSTPIEMELARIDDDDLERGVRINSEIEQREHRAPDSY
jgi:hypothetical protein